MIGVRITNEKTAAVNRNSKKIFEDNRTSVAITNNVALTPANTALFMASVETTTKQTKITYNKLKGIGVTLLSLFITEPLISVSASKLYPGLPGEEQKMSKLNSNFCNLKHI